MTPLLRNRNFSLLWAAQVINTLGNIFYKVGVMVVIFEQTGSALQTVGVMVAAMLPPFLLGPFAGVLVDRSPRKRVMVAMDLLRAALVGTLLLFVREQSVSIWGIYAVVAGLAGAGTFYDPARLAMLPSLVAKADLVRANSLMMSTKQAATAAGYGLGGVLILNLGFRGLVLLDLISFAMAAAVASLIAASGRAPGEDTAFRRVSIGRDVLDGLTYLRHHPLARPLITMEILEHFPHAIWTSALMLVFTEQALGAGAEGWGFQNSAFYGGQLVGATVAALIAGHMAQHPGRIIIWNALLFSLLTAAYALSPTLAVAVILCVLFGPTSAMRDVAQDSLLQASVRPEVMGRIYATRTMLANLSFMLAGILFAWLADQIPVRGIYLIGGLLYLGTGIYALSCRVIRQSRISDPVTSII